MNLIPSLPLEQKGCLHLRRANKHKGWRAADFSRSHSRSNGFSSRMPRDSCSLGVCASDLKQQFISARRLTPRLSFETLGWRSDFLSRSTARCGGLLLFCSLSLALADEKSELLAALHLDERTKKLFNTLTAFRTRTQAAFHHQRALLSFSSLCSRSRGVFERTFEYLLGALLAKYLINRRDTAAQRPTAPKL